MTHGVIGGIVGGLAGLAISQFSFRMGIRSERRRRRELEKKRDREPCGMPRPIGSDTGFAGFQFIPGSELRDGHGNIVGHVARTLDGRCQACSLGFGEHASACQIV